MPRDWVKPIWDLRAHLPAVRRDCIRRQAGSQLNPVLPLHGHFSVVFCRDLMRKFFNRRSPRCRCGISLYPTFSLSIITAASRLLSSIERCLAPLSKQHKMNCSR